MFVLQEAKTWERVKKTISKNKGKIAAGLGALGAAGAAAYYAHQHPEVMEKAKETIEKAKEAVSKVLKGDEEEDTTEKLKKIAEENQRKQLGLTKSEQEAFGNIPYEDTFVG